MALDWATALTLGNPLVLLHARFQSKAPLRRHPHQVDQGHPRPDNRCAANTQDSLVECQKHVMRCSPEGERADAHARSVIMLNLWGSRSSCACALLYTAL